MRLSQGRDRGVLFTMRFKQAHPLVLGMHAPGGLHLPYLPRGAAQNTPGGVNLKIQKAASPHPPGFGITLSGVLCVHSLVIFEYPLTLKHILTLQHVDS
jgi:hypothetical protein